MDRPFTQRESFILDPQRDGFDGRWMSVSGAALAVSGGKFRFNNQEGLVKTELKYGRIEFVVNTPAPATGQDKEFGLKNLSFGNRGKMWFDIAGVAVTVNSYDSAGANVQSTTIQWLAAWNVTDTRFVIEWYNDRIVFSYIDSNGDQQVLATHKMRVGQVPLNFFVDNNNVDNLDVAYVFVDNAHQSSLVIV